MHQANMAAHKILSLPQLPLFNLSICWNISQRSFTTQRSILKKLGFPDKPKKPLNGYMSYVADVRESVKAQYPEMSFPELSKLLGKKWKVLPEAEKQNYENEFKRKLEEYKEEIKEYNKCLTERQKSEMSELITGLKEAKKEKAILSDVKKLEKELNKPKKPLSPYVLFCRKWLQTSQAKPTEVMKELGEKWRKLSDDEKEKYRAMYNKEYEQYQKNLEKWEEEMIQKGNVDLIRMKTLKKKVQKLI